MWLKRIFLGSLLGLTLVVGMGVALFIFFSLARLIAQLGTVSVWFMLALAIAAQLLLTGGMAWFIAGKLGIRKRQLFAGIFAGGAVLIMIVLVRIVLQQPVNVPQSVPQPRPDTRYWALPTGSRLAYTHFAAQGTPRATPIIFLHGGPGSPLRSPDFAFYSQLTRYGFDVYLYDQAGTGLSDRLANVQDYTTGRDVADLEAIRQQIGAAQIVLIGQSWGTTLAADYLAAYPNHVAKIIFSSPGAIWDVGRFKFDYSHTANSVGADPGLPPLRILAAVMLMGSNPNAALWLASEQEVGDYFDNLPSNKILNQNYCPGDEAKIPNIEIHGFNQYVNRITMASQETYPDPRPILKSVTAPALILRGECDFVPPAVAQEYAETLPNATLVQVPGAGHAIFGAQPELALDLLSAFLLDAPLPSVK